MSRFSRYKALNNIFLLLIILFLLPVHLMAANGKDSTVNNDSTELKPLLVVINSYNETKPWVVDIEPIIKAASHHKVKVSLEHLENTRVRNDSLYNIIVNTIFQKYSEAKPDYVVIIGGLATTMVERIRQEWGKDIPMVYVGITDRVGRRSDYYTDIKNFVDFSTWQPVDSVFKDLNLLFVSQPYFPQKTIDLMVKSMPNMKKIIFLGDEKWANRYVDQQIKTYLKDRYPSLKYEWKLCTSDQNLEINQFISQNQESTGLLLSTWSYERHGVLGFPVLVTQDYTTIATAPNPVFTLSPMYLQVGAVGGHFYDEDIFSQNVRSAIDHMLSGDRLDSIPNIKVEKGIDIINYDRYIETNHAFGEIPDGVKIINEPPSLWDRYQWIIIIVSFIMFSSLVIMHIITKDQRMKANFFKQLDSIVQGMPVAFLTIDLKLDENNNIESFKFGQTNQRYRDILRENNMHTREGEHYLSIHKQLTQKVQEAMTNKDGHPVNYTIYFPASGKTYEWLFMRDPGLEKCYVYAVDISELADSKRNLALTKGQLEIALLSARLIPWTWDITNKLISFDRIRTNDKSSSVNDATISRRGHIDNKRLVKLIHPEDRIKLANAFNELACGKKNRWVGFVRIADNTSESPECYHNAKITALTSETDEQGKAVAITGSILIENDTDQIQDRKPTVDLPDEKQSSSESSSNKNILIIEPYDSNYILYNAVLSNNYNIHRSRNIDETNDIISSVTPGLVIINIDADESDVINIEQTVQSIDPDIPIVAIASQATTLRAFKDIIKKRFVSRLTLPIIPRNLIHEISRFI